MSHAPSLRAYPRFARCAFQRRAAYRLANWTGITVNFFFFLVHAQVFFAFFRGRAQVAGWTADDAVRYFATSEALLMVLGVMSTQVGLDLAERIRTGDISVDLARPVRLWARHVAESYGSALYYILTRTAILYAAAVLLYRLPLPMHAAVLWAPVSIALGVGIAAALIYLSSATAYWMEYAQGPLMLTVLTTFLFGGVTVPLDFYPSAMRLIADVLPFRGAVYTPVAITNGTLHGGALLFGLLHQVCWLTLLLVLAHVVEVRGGARVAAHGG